MKKKLYTSLLAVFLVTSLSSCTLFNDDSVPTNFAVEKTTKEDGTEVYSHNLDNRKILSSSGIEALESTGNQKILVIPVEIKPQSGKGYFSELKTLGYSSASEAIEKGFFGESSETGWESVSSYYTKSSYGKLNITGEVAPIYKAPLSEERYNFLTKLNDVIDTTGQIAQDALDEIAKKGTINLADYDTNSDGFIDAIWMVYNLPADGDSDLFWAFTTSNSVKSNSKYRAQTYAWASYHFFGEGGYPLPDSHTFIHETGHILGLDDYYSYSENPESPMGALDMMDYNIGDHCAFSKYLLKWIDPRYIVKEGTYTLKNFQKYGDSIILATNYNGTPFCEYLILEYYNPDGLNYLDSHFSYSMSTYPKMFSSSGLRILHVDARLGYLRIKDKVTWNGDYVNEPKFYNYSGKTLGFIASNTSDYTLSANKSDNLVELVSRNRNDSDFYPGLLSNYATFQDLYVTGTSFSSTYELNDKSKIDYKITVESMNTDEMKLVISKKVQ